MWSSVSFDVVTVSICPLILRTPITYKWNGTEKECFGVWQCRLNCASELAEGVRGEGEGRGTSE